MGWLWIIRRKRGFQFTSIFIGIKKEYTYKFINGDKCHVSFNIHTFHSQRFQIDSMFSICYWTLKCKGIFFVENVFNNALKNNENQSFNSSFKTFKFIS